VALMGVVDVPKQERLNGARKDFGLPKAASKSLVFCGRESASKR
jgi:hypothetical protein